MRGLSKAERNQKDDSNKKLKSQKGLKLFSAISMVLPAFLGSGQKAMAAAHVHHYEKLPGTTTVDDVYLINKYVTVYAKGAIDNYGASWTDTNGVRYYCLDPLIKQPDTKQVQKKVAGSATGYVRSILRAGFGINNAAEMGFPGENARCILATQCAVWEAMKSVDKIVYNDPLTKKIVESIQKKAKGDKYKGSGKTTLTIKTLSKDETTGQATVQVYCHEDNLQIRNENIGIKMTGMTGTFLNAPVGSKITTGHQLHLQLNKKEDGSFEDGKLELTTPQYTVQTPIYQATGRQRGVSIVGVRSGDTAAKWSFSAGQTETPPVPPVNGEEMAQFDIVKKDDEGNPVEGAKFEIFDADNGNESIGILTTDKNGIARSGLLELGHYIAIERSTGKNLEVDNTPIEIDLTPENLKDNAKVTKEKVDGKEISVYHMTYQGPINNHKPPLMTSLLTNLEDNSKFAQPIKGPVVLNEHLYFSHLVGTVSYNVHAWLVDKATGQPITINGQKIEANKTIGSPNEDGNDDGIEAYTDIQLKIPDASSLAGKDIVAFSEIARSDKPDHYTTVHQDINDKNETIHFSKPEIHTTAVNKETEGKKLQPTDGETITDTVDYKELIPGKEYTLHGIVMDKETGKAVMNNGKNVEFTKKFTATAANGSVKASVTFDDHHYRNHRLVVFESLYYTDYLLTDHRDINDVDQSLDVTNPQLHTTLSDNTEKLVSPKKENTVEDVVRYTDLIPGQTYSIRGKLIDQVTGAPVVKHGVPVMATATFQPTMPNGTVTLTFVFDGTQYTGHHLTAFESLYFNGRIVAEHADLNDASQTISVDNSHGIAIPVPTIPRPGKGTIVNNNNNNNNNSNNNNSGNNNSSNNGNNVSNNNEGNNNTPVVNQPKQDKLAILPTGHQVAQAQTQSAEALPKTAPTGDNLPQTGSARDTLAQNVGGIIVVMTVSSMVYFVKRKQTTGLD